MILARVETTARRQGCRIKDNYRGCTVLGRTGIIEYGEIGVYMPSVGEHLYQKTRQDVFVVHHFFEVLDLLLLLFERDLAARLPLFFEPALSVW